MGRKVLYGDGKMSVHTVKCPLHFDDFCMNEICLRIYVHIYMYTTVREIIFQLPRWDVGWCGNISRAIFWTRATTKYHFRINKLTEINLIVGTAGHAAYAFRYLVRWPLSTLYTRNDGRVMVDINEWQIWHQTIETR